MGRRAGFGYFEFEKKVLDKIKKVKDMGYIVGIDGGADVDNIKAIEEAGADILYSEVNYWKLRDA
jgi:pentose-5-phosphate-3-epimerase